MIGSDEFKNKYRQSEKDFTRKRALTFVGLVVSQINLMSKSLSVEVSKFVERYFALACDYTKQAFSKRRSKLKAEAFTALNRELVGQFYVAGGYKAWQGHVVLAVDGSTLQIPESRELVEAFGPADAQGQSMPLGRSSLLYDVENGLVLDALLEEYRASERHLALRHLDYLQGLCLPAPCLLLFDRGYPSLWLLACLQGRGLGFVMRCRAHFLAELAAFAQGAGRDAVLVLELEASNRLASKQLRQFLHPGQTKLYVRAVKIALKNGETEYLLTSLQEASLAVLQELYHKRWGVETGLDLHKNALQIENFSAKTERGVRQDFQARMLAANLSALLIADAEQELEHQQALKGNKHVYQVNRAVALGLVKDNLPSLLMGHEDLEQLYVRLKGKIKRRKEAVRPGRSFPRTNKRRYKFHINKRPII